MKRSVRAGEAALDGGERRDQPLLALDAHQGDAEEGAEQHHRGHDAVGERVEGVRRDVEREEVGGRRRLDERRAEEGRRL
jgi:hypothetical protein